MAHREYLDVSEDELEVLEVFERGIIIMSRNGFYT